MQETIASPVMVGNMEEKRERQRTEEYPLPPTGDSANMNTVDILDEWKRQVSVLGSHFQ